jgi:ABC-2 type transport system ATP-binding protein
MATAISAQQLAVTFSSRGRRPAVEALQPLDLEVCAGQVLGVLGPNGSGKTTLLRVLAGLQRPTAGAVTLLGKAPTDRALTRRVAYQSEGPLPLDTLSAPEYLAFVGAEIGIDNRDCDRRAAALLTRIGLQHAGRRRIRTFSTGMAKRLALAAALLGEPEVLLLDEPTSGLDPFGSATVMELLRERAEAGAAVLMASHHLLEVEESCDEVLVLHNGRVHQRGSLEQLLAKDEHALVVRGLDDDALAALGEQATARGASDVRVERPRDHLFALFRKLGRDRSDQERRR